MPKKPKYSAKPPGFRGKFYQSPRTKTGGPRRCARCGKVTLVSRHGLCPDYKKTLGKWV